MNRMDQMITRIRIRDAVAEYTGEKPIVQISVPSWAAARIVRVSLSRAFGNDLVKVEDDFIFGNVRIVIVVNDHKIGDPTPDAFRLDESKSIE